MSVQEITFLIDNISKTSPRMASSNWYVLVIIYRANWKGGAILVAPA